MLIRKIMFFLLKKIHRYLDGKRSYSQIHNFQRGHFPVYLEHFCMISVCQKNRAWDTESGVGGIWRGKSWEAKTFDRLPTPYFIHPFSGFFRVQNFDVAKESGVGGFSGVKSWESRVGSTRGSESEIQLTDSQALQINWNNFWNNSLMVLIFTLLCWIP